MDTYNFIAKRFSGYDVLSEVEEVEMITKAKAGDEFAKEEFVKHNIKLVISIAQKYKHIMEITDLIQVGTMGLLTAIDRFEIERGFKFSTYASYWILQAISKEVSEKSSSMRIPSYLVEAMPKIKRAEAVLNEKGESLDLERISEISDVDVKKIKRIKKYEIMRNTASLDFEIKEGNGIDLKGTIEQDIYENPEKKIETEEFETERGKAIHEALKTFAPKYREVIMYKYGLDAKGEKRTLEEVSKLVGVTKERVRQIEKSVINLLRDETGFSARRKKLKEFV
jgi:RNA polymerase primary sigma factor